MLTISNLPDTQPYKLFQENYLAAEQAGQSLPYAFAISSYNPSTNQVDSRFVNLKFIDGEDWIFFTNYHSPKAQAFKLHDQVAVLFNWFSTQTQIRIQAKICMLDAKKSDEHFSSRIKEKNAVAIFSQQSQPAKSYEDLEARYQQTLDYDNLFHRPDHWGGYVFKPFYFEFWTANNTRLNHRHAFELIDGNWQGSILEP
tara:strand:- start:3332 stop:3928 length:597 start_codon:yes stop_codon:yes gene_type:complete